MHKMKKVIPLVLAVSMSWLVAGCAVGGKPAADVDSATGGASSSAGKSAETPSSTAVTGSWPENANTANVPAPSFTGSAKQVSVIDSGGITALTYTGVEGEEAEAYLQELKDVGFTGVESDTNVLGTHSYTARNVDTKTHLSFTYTSAGKTLTVSLDRIAV